MTLSDGITEQPPQKTTSIKPPIIHPGSDTLDFHVSLGANQHAHLQITSRLSGDDFEFLLSWIKRLSNDIIENDSIDKEDNNENQNLF